MRLRRARRTGEILVLTISLIATACALYVVIMPSKANPIGGAAILRQTRWGPVDNDDRNLLEKVRQAGLWEIPTGLQAQERAKSERVKELGRILAVDHTQLEKDNNKIAAQLDIRVPSRPSAAQQRWMTELSGLSGEEYDRTFVRRLRAAHGQVFGAIAQVRATTANTLIREYAEKRCHDVVLKHMLLLESTGLVNYRDTREPRT